MKTSASMCSLLLVAGLGCSERGASKASPAEPTAATQPAQPAHPSESARAAGELIAEGTAAPAFRAEAHDGSFVDLSDLRGSPVVLYFYPKDETPG